MNNPLNVIFKTLDGKTFNAPSSLHLLHQLNEDSIANKKKSLTKYMKATSKACKLYNGSEVFTHDRDAFFASLVANGFMTVEGFSKSNPKPVELTKTLGRFGLKVEFKDSSPLVSDTLIKKSGTNPIYTAFRKYVDSFQSALNN